MKKLIALFLSLALVLSLGACHTADQDQGENAESSLVSSEETVSTESSKETLDIIPLKLEMLPFYEVASTVEEITASSNNPWRQEQPLSTMPVMKKGSKMLTTLDATQKANEIALKLGLALGAASVHKSANGGFAVGLSCAEGLQTVSISVDELGTTSILYLHGGKAVPTEYKDNKAYWLVNTYAPLFFGGETVKCGNGDFGTVYKKGNTHKENLINYFFNTVSFAEELNTDSVTMQISPTGALQRVTAKCADYYDAPEYPIISLDTAMDLLAQGKCYRSVTEGSFTVINRESVVSVELIYGMRSTDIHIPCYLFWVEAETDGQRCYVPFTVPAIADEYLDASGMDFLMEINKQ